MPTHHRPFSSHYRGDYEVVEERPGRTRLYPHTEQLPILHRALNLECQTGLPGHIARVDRRGDGYHKILRREAVNVFCACVNVARQDDLRLHCVLDRDLVARVAIVQHITEEDPRGAVHRFRFYAGADFFPEILLSGRRVAFSDHALARFSKRVENPLGEDLTQFLVLFYGAVPVGLRVGPGPAFLVPHGESMLAFPYKEVGDEFFVNTCLTVNEMNSLDRHGTPLIFNPHYDLPYRAPDKSTHNWNVPRYLERLYRCWDQKIPRPTPFSLRLKGSWGRLAAQTADMVRRRGVGPGTRAEFVDRMPGPLLVEKKPAAAQANGS